MNCLSLNVRGMGVVGKDDWVKRLKCENDVVFMALQETKVQGLEKNMLSRLWGGGVFDFQLVDPVGLSGGLACVWNPAYFDKESVVQDRNFLLISGRLKDDNLKINI